MASISKKTSQFLEQGSWIRKMFEQGIALKNQFGEKNIYDLSLGNPIISPPEEFFIQLSKFANENQPSNHRYMPNAGFNETREAIAQNLLKETNLPINQSHIIMTCGTGGALNVALKTLIDPGDEVIIFSPYFVEYKYYIDNHSGQPIVIDYDDNYLPNFNQLDSKITEKTKVILINSPNNPTGVLYTKDTLTKIGELIRKKQKQFNSEIFILSDEPYRKIVFDNLECPNIFDFHEQSIIATSHSKDLGIPGERIGFIAVNPLYTKSTELIDGMTFWNRALGFVNAPALMQRVVSMIQDSSVDIKSYERKRNFLYNSLKTIGYSLIKPQGAFYMFPKSPISDDVKYSKMLQENKVLVVPGVGFGAPGHFRIAYCTTDEVIEKSIISFKKTFEDLKK